MYKLLAGDVLNNLVDLLMKSNVIIALILAAVGITLAFLSKRVARAIRKTKKVEKTDNIVVLMKSVGLILLIIALVLILI